VGYCGVRRVAHFRAGRLRLERASLTQSNANAVVTVRVAMEGTFAGNHSNGTFRFTRVWAQGPSRAWQVFAGQCTEVSG
jgi:hypothetical protein